MIYQRRAKLFFSGQHLGLSDIMEALNTTNYYRCQFLQGSHPSRFHVRPLFFETKLDFVAKVLATQLVAATPLVSGNDQIKVRVIFRLGLAFT